VNVLSCVQFSGNDIYLRPPTLADPPAFSGTITERPSPVIAFRGCMKSTASIRIDPSIAVSVVAAGLFVGAFGSSTTFARTVAALFKAAWLYLSNARG
jgi:hypothetical protein